MPQWLPENVEFFEMPGDFRVKIAQRYIELYEEVAGQTFEPDPHKDPEARIREALQEALPL